MHVRTLAALALALLLGSPLAAQDIRGVIEGVVRDASGAVLPGATVEAKAESGAVLTTVSDGTGTYRFPAVSPGMYGVTATLQGFLPRSVNVVSVGLGQIKKIDFALPLQGVAETLTVTAETPLVDVRQPARQTNIRAEQVELMPKGRDFSSLVTQAPGSNQEAKLGGLSIDGASAGENRWIIDGIETTDIQHGTQGKAVIVDFVEEVQVKSSGYTAEFGGATGGVINVITKSGTNNIRGNALFNFQSSDLEGARRPTLRSSLTTPATVAEYVNYPKDDSVRIEPGFALGGPIVANRAWFFGAYQPALTTTDRAVNPQTAENPSAGTFDVQQKQQVQYATGNVKTQLNDNLSARLAFNNSWSRREGLLPSLAGTDSPITNFGKTTTFPNWTLSGNLDWIASPNLFFGIRGGYYFSDIYDSEIEPHERLIFSTGNNLGFPEVPESLRRSSGFQNSADNFITVRDQQTRLYFQADSTLYGNLAGAHQVKFGFQADQLGNNVDSGESGNLIRVRWNVALVPADPTTRGTYGYYQIRSNGFDQQRGFITQGDITQNVLGFFVQDNWTINNKLTLNLGIRTERERVPYYAREADGQPLPEFGVAFDFADKIAPRLGFAYDVRGDGGTKVFGSWGVFYDIFKLELPRGSFGGDKWLEYYYSLDTFDWNRLLNAPNCPPACPGRILRGAPTAAFPLGGVDFRHISVGSSAIEPDLRPMRQQEATAGLEHQFNDRIAAGVRYVHKQIDRAIEDTGSLDEQGNEIYIIANPGEGLTRLAHPGVALPKAVRDFDSVEFFMERRFANNWFLRGSYLWSRLWGNYSGLSQSDENGRTSPNVGRLFDYPMMMFQDGGEPALGLLPTDRPHQFKAQFIYRLPFGTTLGLNQFVASGLPVTREIGIYPPNTLPVQYLGRFSDGRTPTFSHTDVQLLHEFGFFGDRRLQLSLNVLNLFNQDTAVGRHSTYQFSGGVIPDEDAFYGGRQNLEQLITSQNVPRDPRFLMDNAFQAPIQARFGVKFIF